MGPVLQKLVREAIVGSHERAKDQTAPVAAQPMDANFSPFTAILGLFAQFTEPGARTGANPVGEVEEILIELGLVGNDRREALDLFQAARESPRDFPEMLVLCVDFTRDHVWLRPVLISLLFRLAHAGGSPAGQTISRLQQTCALFGRDYQESLASFREESAQRAVEQQWVAAKMHLAYGVLGCGGEKSLDAIKRRYRALAKELHPDVLATRGLAEEDLQANAEKFREVQEAYQFVLLQRGLR